MAFDLDNEELRATRKLHKINDDLYEETSDKNVGNIEDDVKIVKRYLEDSAYKESDSDFFKNGGWEIVDLEIPKAMANILAKLEQKDKIIQELEKELEKANRQLDLDYVDDNYIPKQKVKDKIELHKNYLLNQAITSNTTLDSHFRDRENYLIQTLQELLEGGK